MPASLCGIEGERKLARRLTLVALGALVLLPTATPAALDRSHAAAERSFDRLPLAAQGAISGVLGRDERTYHASASARGFTMGNRPHALAARFTSEGVDTRLRGTRLGLALRAWGYGGSLRPFAAVVPHARANRILYQRGALTEWYVNGPLGLEQGFTLRSSPLKRQRAPLTLALALSGNALPSLLPDRTGLRFTHSALRYQGLEASDARGRKLPASFHLRGKTLLIRVKDAGARYPLTIDPFLQLAKLTASSRELNFGYSVAASDDTVAVGASNARAVYIFVKPPLGWTNARETAKLTGSDFAFVDGSFGRSVDLDGDIIVAGTSPPGLPYPEPPPNFPWPAAYVFVKPAGGWTSGTETAKLLVPGDPESASTSVAVSGNTIVAGDPSATVDGIRWQGAAYLFVKPEAGWATWESSMPPTAKLTASDPADNNQFGASVAIHGDTVVAGAARNNGLRGAAYVYVRPAGGWATGTEKAKLTASDGAADDFLGSSVAVWGDTVVAGAPSASPAGNYDQGAAYVFVKPLAGWASGNERAKLIALDGTEFDRLGSSVAVNDDTVVAGAPSAAGGGAAYVYRKPPLGWLSGTETSKLTAADGGVEGALGMSAAVSGNTVVVGASGPIYPTVSPSESPTGPLAAGDGAAYVFVEVVPTHVQLRVFSARRSRGAVVLRWRTALDVGILGFNVYRETNERRVKLNRTLIRTAPHSAGAPYSYRDRTPRRAPRYLLEAVRRDGSRTQFGPIDAV
jgi:hypothetical protein